MSLNSNGIFSAVYSEAKALLQRHQLRVTLSRVATLAVLLNSEKAVSIDAAYAILFAMNHPISRASIYRALSEFEKAGIAVQGWENIDTGRMVYARAPEKALAPDHLITCRQCGRAIQFQDKLMAQQLYYHALQSGFDRQLSSLRISMICNDCA